MPPQQLLLLLLLLLPNAAQAFVPARVPTVPVTASSTSSTATSSLFRRSPLPPTAPSSVRTPLPRLWQIRSDQQHTEDYFRFIEGKEVRTCGAVGHGKLEWKRQCRRRVVETGREGARYLADSRDGRGGEEERRAADHVGHRAPSTRTGGSELPPPKGFCCHSFGRRWHWCGLSIHLHAPRPPGHPSLASFLPPELSSRHLTPLTLTSTFLPPSLLFVLLPFRP